MSTTQTRRDRYHHGDLRRALVEAGTRLARAGGPDAVVLRAATRQAGVSANAAYRHFADRDALVGAVVLEGLAAMARAMEAELAGVDAVDPEDDGDPAAPGERARARLRAVGAGYVGFARAEPGLFRTTFLYPADLSRAVDPAGAGDSGRTPYQLLSEALDDLVAAGVVARGQRPGAELLAWSAVHGLAVLAVNGALRALPDEALAATTDRLLSMVDAGLALLPDGDDPRATAPPQLPSRATPRASGPPRDAGGDPARW